MSAAKTETEDLEEIQRLVEEVDHRPRTVRAIDIELGEDSTGDPAAWIWPTVDARVEGSNKAIRDITRFAGRIRASILARAFTHWPYVRLKVAVKRGSRTNRSTSPSEGITTSVASRSVEPRRGLLPSKVATAEQRAPAIEFYVSSSPRILRTSIATLAYSVG
jgi:hypothetical protein